MLIHNMAIIKCEHCEAVMKNNKWDKIRTSWFFTRDGKHYCPEHIPEWVSTWRSRSTPTN